MELLTGILHSLFSLIFLPFDQLPPLWELLGVSMLTGAVMIAIAAATSRQDKLRHIKDQLKADLLSMRLYQYDAAVMLKNIGRLFLNNLRYMRQLLRPMLFLVLPVSLIMIQLSIRYQYRPAGSEEPLLVSAVFEPGTNLQAVDLNIEHSRGDITGPLRIPAEQTAYWRVSLPAGTSFLRIFSPGDSAGVRIPVARPPGQRFISGSFYRPGDYRRFLEPAADPLPPSKPIRHVRIHYRPASIGLDGAGIHWLYIFFIGSILTGLLIKTAFGITL